MDMVALGLIALVIGAGVAGALVTTWKLHRRTLALEYRADDLEERVLTLKNREKVEKRWAKEKTVDQELQEFVTTAKLPSRSKVKYANDPLGEDE